MDAFYWRDSWHVTPKVAIGAVVGNDDGELLLIQRSDSGVWLFPTGFADVGYSAAEIAEKEVLEETSMEVEAVRIISILDGVEDSQGCLCSIVFQCKVVGGTLKPHPLNMMMSVSFLSFFLSLWQVQKLG